MVIERDIIKDAALSEDGLFRYTLTRWWGEKHFSEPDCGLWMPIGMLNPSTADSFIDDPTIRRCVSFAAGLGYNGLLVVNLYAYRTSDPSDLADQPDAIGPRNDDMIRSVLRAARGHTLGQASIEDLKFYCAWGVATGHVHRHRKVLGMAIDTGFRPFAFRRTKAGWPAHPLYLPADVQPAPYYEDTRFLL